MKVLITICVLLMLGGCVTNPPKEQPIALKYKYVVMLIPDEMLEIPEVEKTLNTNTATDKDAAKWMVYWERRYQEIEKRLKTIKTYQDRRLKELTLPPEDVIKN